MDGCNIADMMIRRVPIRTVAIIVVLAGCLVGCYGAEDSTSKPAATLGETVELLTDSEHTDGLCYTMSTTATLDIDPKFGTNVNGKAGGTKGMPVMWPKGFTGRKFGDRVAVLDPDGKIVATTGHEYNIPGGMYQPEESLGVETVWLACNQVFDPNESQAPK